MSEVTEKDLKTFEDGIVLAALALYAAVGGQKLAVEVARDIGARLLEKDDASLNGETAFAVHEAQAKAQWSKTVWAAAQDLLKSTMKKGGRG